MALNESKFHSYLNILCLINSSSRILKIFHDSGQCKLIILNVSTADLGEYSCIATNELGMDRTSAHIFIGGRSVLPF